MLQLLSEKMLMRLLYLIAGPRRYRKETVRINGRRINAYMADTFLKKMFGLMYFNIEKDEAMLFPFDWESRQMTAITMLNMKYNIDIVWLNSKGIVVDIVENAEPSVSLWANKDYLPKEKAKYVLEFRSGIVKKLGIEEGGRIGMPF